MKRISAILLVFVLLCGVFALPAIAETVTQDGIQVTLVTDKERYDALDVIDAQLKVKNTNDFAVDGVSMEITAPEGYALSGKGGVKVGELSAGEAQMQQADMRNTDAAAPKLPGTGDESDGMQWGLLFVGSAALCALMIVNPKAKRVVSLFLCVSMVGAMVLEAAPALAAGKTQEETITVTKRVTVDGKPVELTGTVKYAAAKTFAMARTAEAPAEDFVYAIKNGEVAIYAYKGTAADLVIPAYIEGYPVTTIGGGEWYHHPTKSYSLREYIYYEDYDYITEDIYTVSLPDTVERIERRAFANFVNLKSVRFPNGTLEYIGSDAFYNCKSLKEIDIYTAGDLKIATNDIITTQGLSNRGYRGAAFAFCDSLEKVNIVCGGSLTMSTYENSTPPISPFVTGNFKDCFELKEVNLTAKENLELGMATFSGCASLEKLVLNSKGTVELGGYAFYDCAALTSVTLPEATVTMDQCVFSECRNLEELHVPKGLVSIVDDQNYPPTFLYTGYNVGGLTVYGYTGSYIESFIKEYNQNLNDEIGDYPVKFVGTTYVCKHSKGSFTYEEDNTVPLKYKDNGDGLTHLAQPTLNKYCNECGAYAGAILGAGTAYEHTMTNNVCTLCGYTQTCAHTTYNDVYNQEIPVQYVDNKDGKTHTYQNGFDRTCDVCKEVIAQVYGEATTAEHDYTEGDVCPCGYDRSSCKHESDGGYEYLRDKVALIWGNATHHRVTAYVYETTCTLCKAKYEVESPDGGVNRPVAPHDEDKHVFEEGACGSCGYVCAHPEKDADGNANYQDVYVNSIRITDNGDGTHAHTYNVKRTCLTCKATWTQEIYDPAEEHNICELTEKGAYRYNADEHWLEVPVGCSCGYLTGEKVTKEKAAHNLNVTTTYRYDPDGNVHQVWEIKNFACVCEVAYEPVEELIGPDGHSNYDNDGRCDKCGEVVYTYQVHNDHYIVQREEVKRENALAVAILQPFYTDHSGAYEMFTTFGSELLVYGTGIFKQEFEDALRNADGGLDEGRDIVHEMVFEEAIKISKKHINIAKDIGKVSGWLSKAINALTPEDLEAVYMVGQLSDSEFIELLDGDQKTWANNEKLNEIWKYLGANKIFDDPDYLGKLRHASEGWSDDTFHLLEEMQKKGKFVSKVGQIIDIANTGIAYMLEHLYADEINNMIDEWISVAQNEEFIKELNDYKKVYNSQIGIVLNTLADSGFALTAAEDIISGMGNKGLFGSKIQKGMKGMKKSKILMLIEAADMGREAGLMFNKYVFGQDAASMYSNASKLISINETYREQAEGLRAYFGDTDIDFDRYVSELRLTAKLAKMEWKYQIGVLENYTKTEEFAEELIEKYQEYIDTIDNQLEEYIQTLLEEKDYAKIIA